MNKIIVILTLCIALTSIRANATPMESMFESWYEESIENVIKSWGNPTVVEHQEGQTKYIWRKQINKKIPNTNINKTFKCDRILYVDIAGKVVFGKAVGNNCRAEENKKFKNKKS